MAGWREKKRTMLSDVHNHFEISAVYLTHGTGTPIAVTVRVHRKPIVARPQFETDAAAMLDTADRIIFQKSQLPVVPDGVMSKAYVILSSSEAYFTGPSKPERDAYIWVEVSEVAQTELTALIADLDLSDPAWIGVLT